MNQVFTEQLNAVLGECLDQSPQEITVWHKKVTEAYELKKNGTVENIDNDIAVMEIYISVLYTIIAIATFFRADLNSEIAVEKRLNLKYLCFISTEFYKSIFIVKKPNSLWHKLKSILSAGNHTCLLEIVDEINEKSSSFRTNYFNSKRRDISLHYDFDLDTVYQHLCEIDEEYEAQQTASLLAVLQPLKLVCGLYLKSGHPNTSDTIDVSQESSIHKKFRKELYENIYDIAGSNLQSFGEYLDQAMKSYHLIDKPQVRELLSNEHHARLSQFRECIKLAVLLHYFYLDLGTAVRGYIRSDNYYEQQLNAIRISVIIYEGYKKIFLPQNKAPKVESLWEQYIRIPIMGLGNSSEIAEMESLDKMLLDYSADEEIKDIRHKYSHFKKNNQLYLIDLWRNVITIDPVTELNKALRFLQIISRIIKLSKSSLEYFAQKERERERRKVIAPLEDIFAKAIDSCKTVDDKEKLRKLKEEFSNTVLESLDKMTQSHKGNKHK